MIKPESNYVFTSDTSLMSRPNRRPGIELVVTCARACSTTTCRLTRTCSILTRLRGHTSAPGVLPWRPQIGVQDHQIASAAVLRHECSLVRLGDSRVAPHPRPPARPLARYRAESALLSSSLFGASLLGMLLSSRLNVTLVHANLSTSTFINLR